MTRLEAQELTCAYHQHTVLHDLSLTVQPGEILALLGPNGAGKTTLLRALARLLRPRTGTVLLAGTNIWRLRPRAVARCLALAPQNQEVSSPLTVAQAVALGRAPHRGWPDRAPVLGARRYVPGLRSASTALATIPAAVAFTDFAPNVFVLTCAPQASLVRSLRRPPILCIP